MTVHHLPRGGRGGPRTGPQAGRARTRTEVAERPPEPTRRHKVRADEPPGEGGQAQELSLPRMTGGAEGKVKTILVEIGLDPPRA